MEFEKQIARKSIASKQKHVHSSNSNSNNDSFLVDSCHSHFSEHYSDFFSTLAMAVTAAIAVPLCTLLCKRNCNDIHFNALNLQNGIHFPDSMNASHRRLNTPAISLA